MTSSFSSTTTDIGVRDGQVRLGDHLSLSFQRTLRIPDDGSTYPLPPGLGALPVHRVADHADRVPAEWRERGGLFIPMYQREALWLSFGHAWPPVALKVGIGGIDAISGKRFRPTHLGAKRQDYLVLPDQPWLDGINAGDGYIRQFVAMPLGSGATVEGQLTGAETEGGMRLTVVPAKPGRFGTQRLMPKVACAAAAPAGGAMGLGAGGRMRQNIVPDTHGVDTWDLDKAMTVDVHIVNSLRFRAITGHEPPPTPVDARTYTEHGLPWFSHYSEHGGDVKPGRRFDDVRPVSELDIGPDQVVPAA
jgi:hypothetical protein